MRTQPPARRQQTTSQLQHGNLRYHISVGTDHDGKVLEVFISSIKRSNDADDVARDFGLVLSLALQHGCPLEDISSALGENTFAGAVINEINKMTMLATETVDIGRLE